MVRVHPWCIFILYWLLNITVVWKLYEEAEDSFFSFVRWILSMLLSKPFLGGLEMTSGGMYTVKTCQEFILSLVNSWDTIKPSSTQINPDYILWLRVVKWFFLFCKYVFLSLWKDKVLVIDKHPTSISCFTQKSQTKPSASLIMRFNLFGFVLLSKGWMAKWTVLHCMNTVF